MRRRLFLAALLSALTFPVGAADIPARAMFRHSITPILKQFVVVAPDGAGLVPGTTTLATCTASAVLYADASKVVQCNGPAFETSTGVGISATPIT